MKRKKRSIFNRGIQEEGDSKELHVQLEKTSGFRVLRLKWMLKKKQLAAGATIEVKPVYRWPKRWRPSDYPIKRKFVFRSSPLQFWAAISTIWESFQRKHIVVLLSWIRSAFMSQSELLKAWASSSKCINNKIWSILIAPNEAKSRLRSAEQSLNAGKSPKSTSAPAI